MNMAQQDDDPEVQALIDAYQRNRAYAKPGPYQTTLSPKQEQDFQGWLFKNNIPYNLKWPADQSMQDYDMRGYWKALQSGDAETRDPKTLHFPDVYKTPYHKTFSNQSKYATPEAPHWEGNRLIDKDGRVLIDETPK
jgi:hypothetical protein